MPSISQLAPGTAITATDVLPLDQSPSGGALVKFTSAQLAAWVADQIASVIGVTAATINGSGQLVLTIGGSGTIVAGSVAAPGFTAAAITGGDLILTKSNGGTVNLGNVIGATGTAGSPGGQGAQGAQGIPGSSVTITNLGTVEAMAATDRVGISQAGTDVSIPLADLLDGTTIDQFSAANAAADTDVFPVGQGTSSLVAQTFAALWAWMQGKLPLYRPPVLEITANTTLDGAAHNGKILIVSAAGITLTHGGTEGSGFVCTVINGSSGDIYFDSGTATTSGVTRLPTGQAAEVYCIAYSLGTFTYAWVSGPTTSPTPGAPVGLITGAVTYTSVALSWSAPVGGGAPSGYIVQYRITNSGAPWTQQSSSVLNATIYSLAPATEYDFEIIAVNVAGGGAPSSIVNATTSAAPTSVPGQVISLVAASTAATSAALTWAAPTTGGAVGTYTVQYRVTGQSAWITSATGITALGYTATGLTTSTAYDFQVFAVNTAGSGSPSSIANGTTTLAAPNAPTALTTTATAQTTVTMGWTAPASGTSVASYTLQYRISGGGSWTQVTGITGTSQTLTGLTAATSYDVQVAAVNAGGASAFTATTNATTGAAAPGLPTALTAGQSTSTTQALTWTAPASGGAVATYTVRYSVHAANTWTSVTGITGTSATIAGLTLNTSYDFEVESVNGGGNSGWTAAVTASTTNYLLTIGLAPTSNVSWSHGVGGNPVSVNTNTTSAAGSHPAPANCYYAYSTSSTVPPASGWAIMNSGSYSPGSGQTGYGNLYVTQYAVAPATTGVWYLWFQALDGSGIVQAQYCNPYTVTAT